MKPDQVSNKLYQIASRIDNSKQPSRELVAREIRSVLYQIAAAGDWPVKLSTYDNWINDLGKPPTFMESADFLKYLEQDESNAVILHRKTGFAPIVIINGAGGKGLYGLEATSEVIDDGVRPQDFDGPYYDFGELVNEFFS